jgi:NAD(P)-dependent dehydrogenase (short-subunit alcohol dehydrogenase family)
MSGVQQRTSHTSNSRTFSKAGYSVALIARREDSVKKLAEEIEKSGGEVRLFHPRAILIGSYVLPHSKAIPLPVSSYTPEAFSSAFSSLKSHPTFTRAKHEIRGGLFNVGYGVWKPFLSITPAEVQESVETNIVAAFSFARESILAFKQNPIVVEEGSEEEIEASTTRGKRGVLIFTGATASLRGNTTTSVFAAGKHGLRGLSQSLAKEFGKDNIHVSLNLCSVR